jgi:hypothetical protein
VRCQLGRQLARLAHIALEGRPHARGIAGFLQESTQLQLEFLDLIGKIETHRRLRLLHQRAPILAPQTCARKRTGRGHDNNAVDVLLL